MADVRTDDRTETAQVAIAGGGPTGLMLACELRLAGVDVLVLERLDAATRESRAGGIHARTMEVLDQRGLITDDVVAPERRMNAAHFSAIPLDVSGLETRYPYLLRLLQHDVEALLAARAAELGVRVRRGAELVAYAQDADGVDITLRSGDRVRAGWLVGCDGGRSTVRRLAGIGFPGTPATMTALLADVELAEAPPRNVFQERTAAGSYSVLAFGPGWYRVMTNEYDRVIDRDAAVVLDDVREAMLRIAGTDFGMRAARWVSRFSDAARQADRYLAGRVLLAGDAAHIHFPAGGQGLNTGVQDAANLGWKLAAVVRGTAPEGLLDTYESERAPVAARVLANTRAQTVLGAPGEHMTALRGVVEGLIAMEPVNRALAGMITALDVRYEMGDTPEPPSAARPAGWDPLAGLRELAAPHAGRGLLGMRMPDVELTAAASGATRVYELLRSGRGVLLDLGAGVTASGWEDRVDVVKAAVEGRSWALPTGESVEVPGAVLIRPDGHVAWLGACGGEETASAAGLREALGRWFGEEG